MIGSFDEPVIRRVLHPPLAGLHQSVLDLARHGEDLLRIGFDRENRLALLQGKREGTHVVISSRETPRNTERFVALAELLIRHL